MNKKYFNPMLFFALICIIFTACAPKSEEISAQQKNYSHASWSDTYSELQSLINDSELIVTATYVDSETELRSGLVFTWEQWRVSNVLHGNATVGDVINIRKTGGTYGDTTTYELEEIPLTANDDTREYIFFLEGNTENLDYYAIVGGYTGCGIIDNSPSVAEASVNSNDGTENIARAITPVWDGNTIFEDISVNDIEIYMEVCNEENSD